VRFEPNIVCQFQSDRRDEYNAVNGTTVLINVNKATLTARADDKTKVYGQINPPLTITYTGFVNGDNSVDITVPSISTTATTSSQQAATD